MEYECVLGGIEMLSLDERCWMLTPVPEWVEMMRCVVAVIKAVTITLCFLLVPTFVQKEGATYRHIDQSDARPVVRIWLIFIHKGVLTPISNHQTQT